MNKEIIKVTNNDKISIKRFKEIKEKARIIDLIYQNKKNSTYIVEHV